MRLIGELQDESQALIFSRFLNSKEIAHEVEIKKNTDWSSPSYGTSRCLIWIVDEDQKDKVLEWFYAFKDNSQDPLFFPPKTLPPAWIKLKDPLSLSEKSSPPSASRPIHTSWEKQSMGWISSTLLAVCCVLFALTYLWKPLNDIPENYSALLLFTSPISQALLYDDPLFFQLIDRFIQQYGFQQLEHPTHLSIEGQSLLKRINTTTYWPGFYELLKGGWQEIKQGVLTIPLFEKIREGEVWRLFSPCLLHGDPFHLLFNMLWLIVLGKQIELRLKSLRYILFILIIGVISNTAQYLMGGPIFIGFSGILCGMLAFIWTRLKHAPWEGYQLDRLTILFMLIFILGLATIQFFAFFLEKSLHWTIPANIANTAHITGGFCGYLLGKMNFFSWRHS